MKSMVANGAGQVEIFPGIPEGDVESVIDKQIRFAGDSAAEHFGAAGGQEINQVKIIEVESKDRDQNGSPVGEEQAVMSS
jgi:hypothetical protein